MKGSMRRALDKTNDRVIAMGAEPDGPGVEVNVEKIGLLYIGLPITSWEADELVGASITGLGRSIATGDARTPAQELRGMLHSVLVAGIMIGMEEADDAE